MSMNWVRRTVSGLIEPSLHAETADGDGFSGDLDLDTWGDLESRRLRYAFAWGLYQNTAFRDVHRWAAAFREKYGLYHAIRNVYNPVDRIVEFAAAHIYGGGWDADAGDGKEVLSAAPIVGDGVTPALREAVARVWRDSLWPLNVETWVRNGALFGDAPAKVAVDAVRGKVFIELIHPKTVTFASFDHFGHVKGYAIERRVPDPRAATRIDLNRSTVAGKLVYAEERCWREGDDVVFATSLIDGGKAIPWDWTREADDQRSGMPSWRVRYGFVPLVWTRHVALGGLDYGLSEYHTARPKVIELDDQASKLNDQIRKVVDPKWLFSGMRAPKDSKGKSRLDLGVDRSDDSERDSEGAIYAKDPNAKGIPLVAPLQIADALANIGALAEEIERGFPELRFDRIRAGGEVSGEALRVARQPTETKVNRRRLRYDTDLVRLHQMALAIGGHTYRETRDRRFEVFAPFDLDSYAAGDLDHQIGPRPVFGEDPHEAAARRTAVYSGVEAAKRAGMPARVAWREAGYTDDQIDEMESFAEEEAKANAERMAAFRGAAGLDNDNPEDNGDDVFDDETDDDEDGRAA